MKKYFYLLICSLFTFNGFAQNVPNGDFENWTNFSGYSTPVSWNTTDSIASTQGGQRSVLQENSVVYHGNSAMKMQSWTYSGFFNEPGAASNGTLNTTTFQFQGGTPDTTRHDMLTGWYEYSPAGGDSCTVSVTLSKWTGSAHQVLGSGSWSAKNTISSYTQFSIPITYALSGNPDTVLIVIAAAPLGLNTAHAGTIMYVDYLNFVGINSTNDLPANLVSVNAYPNPASDFLTIESKWKTPIKTSVSILDMSGRLLQTIPVIDNKQRIDMSALSNGNYFYELMDEKGNKVYTGKFSVNH